MPVIAKVWSRGVEKPTNKAEWKTTFLQCVCPANITRMSLEFKKLDWADIWRSLLNTTTSNEMWHPRDATLTLARVLSTLSCTSLLLWTTTDMKWSPARTKRSHMASWSTVWLLYWHFFKPHWIWTSRASGLYCTWLFCVQGRMRKHCYSAVSSASVKCNCKVKKKLQRAAKV